MYQLFSAFCVEMNDTYDMERLRHEHANALVRCALFTF